MTAPLPTDGEPPEIEPETICEADIWAVVGREFGQLNDDDTVGSEHVRPD